MLLHRYIHSIFATSLPAVITLLSVVAAAHAIDPRFAPLSPKETRQTLQQISDGETPDTSILLRALVSDQTTLRARAARLLGDIPRDSADELLVVGSLIAALDDETFHEGAHYPMPGMATTRWWAHESLKKISGQDFGYRWDAPKPERTAAIARWNAWWQQRSLQLIDALRHSK